MPWYSGPTLLEVLETVDIQREVESQPLRFPVQYVNRPNLDFRGFSGTVASGTVHRWPAPEGIAVGRGVERGAYCHL